MEGAFYGAQKKQKSAYSHPPVPLPPQNNDGRGAQAVQGHTTHARLDERASASCEPLTAGLVKVAGDTVSVPGNEMAEIVDCGRSQEVRNRSPYERPQPQPSPAQPACIISRDVLRLVPWWMVP